MPRQKSDRPKASWLHLRLDAGERAALERQAQRAGRTMADVARAALFGGQALGDPELETGKRLELSEV